MASIRRKNNNSYEIRVSCGYDVRGKQVIQQMTWIPEKGMTQRQIDKELQRQIVLFEEECRKGHMKCKMKFETFAEQWFEEYAKLNLRPTTYERMLQLKKRIYPAIGHMRMDKITRRDIRLFINDLVQNGRNFNNGKPLSKKTIVHHLSFISDVFNYAVDLDLIYDNPCRNIKIPNMGEEKEKEIYSPEELDRLFLLLKNEPLKYRVFFTLAVYTGFRKGELLGLEWKDIDWDNRIIYVRRTSNYTGKKGIYTGRPKTKRSKRCNRYPQELFDLLKEFKDEQDLDRQRIGDEWQDYDRLFVKADGQPMNTRTPYGWLKEFCERNDLRFCTIHSLRHINHMKTFL